MRPSALHFHKGPSDPRIPMAGNLEVPEAENPDARIFLLTPTDSAIAHVALWWNDTPSADGNRTGAIGALAASDGDAASLLLSDAIRRLRDTGCEMVVGPLHGNSWRRHCCVVESDGRGPFFLEPRNPPEHPDWWLGAGFREWSRYSSSLIKLDVDPTVVSTALKQRLAKSGIVVRAMDPARFDDELRMIHAVSLRNLQHNLLHTPLAEKTFLAAYRRIREPVDPELVRIATRDGEACGIVFAIPDLEAVARGEKPAMIVMTLAVDPASRNAGLGSLLVDGLHRIGCEKGFTEAIHAVQPESDPSLKITGRPLGRIFRRYAIYSHPL